MPRSDEERHYGKATLLAPGDIEVMLKALKRECPDCIDLIDKLEELRYD